MQFVWCCSLPPTENHLVGRRHFPTAPYKAWLRLESVRLALALREAGFREPDTTAWWMSTASVTITRRQRSDAATAYMKAVHDLLSGAQIDRRSGRIVKPGGLWNDDRRIRGVHWMLADVAGEVGAIVVTLETINPPRGAHDAA